MEKIENKPLRKISKNQRLQEIAENRREFNLFRKSIQSNFYSTDAELRRKICINNAEQLEKDANPSQETYKQTALNYYQAGIYSVALNDPKNAWRFFRNSSRNYTQFAELVKSEPIYGLIVQEINVQNRNATLSRHEAARRRATNLWISFGFCDSITSFLNTKIYSKK